MSTLLVVITVWTSIPTFQLGQQSTFKQPYASPPSAHQMAVLQPMALWQLHDAHAMELVY